MQPLGGPRAKYVGGKLHGGIERAGGPSTVDVEGKPSDEQESEGEPVSSMTDVEGILYREVEPAGGRGPHDARCNLVLDNPLTCFLPAIGSLAAANSRALGRRCNRST